MNHNMQQFKVLPMYSVKPKKGDAKVVSGFNAFHFAIGSVLGDGSIHKKKFFMAIEQKSPTFTLWKHELASQFGFISTKTRSKRAKVLFVRRGNSLTKVITLPKLWTKIHKKRSKQKPSTFVANRHVGFTLRALFREEWRSLFYTETTTPGRAKFRKCIPAEIAKYFWGNLALAIFFLDDGWVHWKNGTVCFSSGTFSEEECNYLIDCFERNFNMEVSLMKSNGKPHHLYVKVSSYKEFYKRVLPYINALYRKYPRYALNPAMKNKVLFPLKTTREFRRKLQELRTFLPTLVPQPMRKKYTKKQKPEE